MKRLAIFDLDGTLLNTIKDLGIACNYALEKNGYSGHSLATYPFMVGNGVRKLIQRSCPDADETMVDTLLADFKHYYDEHNTEYTTPYNGIPELLQRLVEMDIKIAVASNKYQTATDKIVRHFFADIPFVSIQGQIEGRPVKPDPSIVFTILNQSPTPKSEVIYIGDSAVDIETARRACVTSVGVTWGFRTVSELRQAYADHIISSPSEILNLLNEPF